MVCLKKSEGHVIKVVIYIIKATAYVAKRAACREKESVSLQNNLAYKGITVSSQCETSCRDLSRS